MDTDNLYIGVAPQKPPAEDFIDNCVGSVPRFEHRVAAKP